LALFAAFFFVFAATPTALGARQAATQAGVLHAINAARTAHGLRPLRLDAGLDRAAAVHTAEMLRGNYFAHGDFAGRMTAFHLGGTLGENLAWGSGSAGSPRSIVQMWLASPEHRANLLRPGFRRLGLGLGYGAFQGQGSATVVTADFGS
jgi:uncharacterized protein YkwD